MLFINLVCDEENCNICQPIQFENEQEKYLDLITAIKNAGWSLTIENGKIIKSICNKHP